MGGNVERLLDSLADFPLDDIRAALTDPTRAARVRAAFDELAEPDFEVAMIASPGFTVEERGFGGFVNAWVGWIEPYETYLAELEEVIDGGDHVVTLVRQRGVPKGSTREVASASAAVWSFRDGKLSRVEFHLDREAALRRAGIDPSA